jgi:hypothetical protein
MEWAISGRLFLTHLVTLPTYSAITAFLFFIQGRTGTDQLVEFIKKSLELLH